VWLVLAWGDYSRTRMALQDTRSALWAGLCTWGTILLNPLRTLRPMALLTGVELVGLAAVWRGSRLVESWIAGPGAWRALGLLLSLGVAGIALRMIVRGARYAAALEIAGEVVRPLPRPDPWRGSVGGPGGPRYPIGGDEYSVSL
jgi:hypothetical protein